MLICALYTKRVKLGFFWTPSRANFYPLGGSITPVEYACNKLKEKPPSSLLTFWYVSFPVVFSAYFFSIKK